ncbi:MAG: enoyl-CoA hydratase-related protein [Elusimicrobiota bacterium]
MGGYQHLRVEAEGPVATVTLDRPDVRNALDDRTIAELAGCFRSFKKGSSRVVVLRGAGTDFCAGADLRWMRKAAGYTPAKNRADARRLAKMLLAIEECPLPVICRVHGGTYGGGIGLVAACDMAVAAADARMVFSECRLGILPAVITPFILPKTGPGWLRRLYLSAEMFGMDTALRAGLVHDVVPAAELDARVEKLAKSILACGPQALRECKDFIRKAPGLDLAVETLVRVRASAEGKAGLDAFLEKRPAAWLPAKC